MLSTDEKLKEFCRWLITDAEGLTIEERVTYQFYLVTYNIIEDEEVKNLMGRKVLRPDYDKAADWLYECMPPEIRNKVAQRLLGVNSPEEAILKLAKAQEKQEDLVERILEVDSPEGGAQRLLGVDSPEEGVQKLLGVDSLEEAILKLAKTREQQKEKSRE